MKKLQAANVPVIWRPLHEAGGTWFWWGAKGSQACKDLYDIIYDRLVNHHQIHNLIWAWSSPEADWYPGNAKVDLIGYDSYPGVFNYTIQKTMFDQLFKIVNGEKLIAMTENGPIPDIEKCLTMDAPWSYFMMWGDSYIGGNSSAHLQEVFNNPNVLTIENPGSCNVTTSVTSSATHSAFTDFYPNPSSEIFNVKASEHMKCISVFNMQGVKMEEVQDVDAGESVELGKDLDSGMYVMIVEYESGIRSVAKMIKEK